MSLLTNAASADNPLTMTDRVRAQLEEAMRRGYVAAFRWLRDPDESRDACQEAAARALRAEHQYDPARPFYPWFYRILRNHCVDRLGDPRRAVHEPVEIPAAVDDAAEGRLLEAERARAVTSALEALPDELREILELRHFQDASYEEIAHILDMPIGTVMSRLYRARKALRSRLLADPGFGAAQTTGGLPQ